MFLPLIVHNSVNRDKDCWGAITRLCLYMNSCCCLLNLRLLGRLNNVVVWKFTHLPQNSGVISINWCNFFFFFFRLKQRWQAMWESNVNELAKNPPSCDKFMWSKATMVEELAAATPEWCERKRSVLAYQ